MLLRGSPTDFRKVVEALPGEPSGFGEVVGFSRYDLVLMDIGMPEVDGFEATRQIRAQESAKQAPRVPILALTAHAVKGYRERCLDAGCTGYLAKPVRKPALLEAVAAAIAAGRRGDGCPSGASPPATRRSGAFGS